MPTTEPDRPPAELSPPDSTICRTCREEIKPGARKCVRCDSYQDWRRFLSMSSSVLALLIALISVLTVAVPIIVVAVHPNKSDLVVAVQDVSSARTFRLFVSNQGNRPAALGRARFVGTTHSLGNAAGRFTFPLNLVGGSSQIVPAGGATILTYTLNLPDAPPLPEGVHMPSWLGEHFGTEYEADLQIDFYDSGSSSASSATSRLATELANEAAFGILVTCTALARDARYERICADALHFIDNNQDQI